MQVPAQTSISIYPNILISRRFEQVLKYAKINCNYLYCYIFTSIPSQSLVSVWHPEIGKATRYFASVHRSTYTATQQLEAGWALER